MPSLPEIKVPEPFAEGAARRAYEMYGKQHKGMGMNFPPWKNVVIAVKANWRAIFMAGLGVNGEIMVVNKFNRDPHTLIITGFTKEGLETFQKALGARLGGVTRITPAAEELTDDPEPTVE